MCPGAADATANARGVKMSPIFGGVVTLLRGGVLCRVASHDGGMVADRSGRAAHPCPLLRENAALYSSSDSTTQPPLTNSRGSQIPCERFAQRF
jgi:hypothetical protein